jgi:hypothetical protein
MPTTRRIPDFLAGFMVLAETAERKKGPTTMHSNGMRLQELSNRFKHILR